VRTLSVNIRQDHDVTASRLYSYLLYFYYEFDIVGYIRLCLCIIKPVIPYYIPGGPKNVPNFA